MAASVAARALADGARRAAELRHPERAAAWLRHRVLRRLPGEPGRLTRDSEPGRRATLRALGVSDAAFTALAALPTVERAAFVATDIERLEAHDVESIVGKRGPALRRLVLRARSRYLAVAADHAARDLAAATLVPGTLAAQIAEEAARTLGARSEARP